MKRRKHMRRNPSEKVTLERKARAAGKKFAMEQLESELFDNWVSEMLNGADVSDLPRSKKKALRVASNILIDFRYELERQFDFRDVARKIGTGDYWAESHGTSVHDLVHEFWSAFADVLDKKNTRTWLADNVMYRADERREF
jgi:hypothetical protein